MSTLPHGIVRARSCTRPTITLSPPMMPPHRCRCFSNANAPPLAMQALQFAVDQAPFACPGSTYSHPISGDNTSRNGGGSSCVRVGGGGSGGGDANSAAACKDTVSAADSDAASVRLAVRAGLQFACNYCVGSEANKTLLWDAWFPRGLMVRACVRIRPLCRVVLRFARPDFWSAFLFRVFQHISSCRRLLSPDWEDRDRQSDRKRQTTRKIMRAKKKGTH